MWAKAHYNRFERWPSCLSGPVLGVPGETWFLVNNALYGGHRGLPGGDSLSKLLKRRVNRIRWGRKPRLKRNQIILWACDHFSKSGQWPSVLSGPISAAPGEHWRSIDQVLRCGGRGLPGGHSLAKLLDETAGPMRKLRRPPLSIQLIVGWAKAHHRQTGVWPLPHSGNIPGASGESWTSVSAALRGGQRGLPGGDSLARVLHRYLGKPMGRQRQRLSKAEIARWANAHHRKHGRWPQAQSGPIDGAPGWTWQRVDSALWRGARGIPGGSSLSRFLRSERGEAAAPASLKVDAKAVLHWADQHKRDTGRWPATHLVCKSPIRPLSWYTINARLREGRVAEVRSGTNLVDFLIERRGAKIRRPSRTKLTVEEVLKFADLHYKRTGDWPRIHSGTVQGAREELTWHRIQTALLKGGRGLPTSGGLAPLLQKHRGARNRALPPPLTISRILEWMDAHHERTGRWPAIEGGKILEAPGETWEMTDRALRAGRRGLPRGLSIPTLLARYRGELRGQHRPRLALEKVRQWAVAHHRRTGSWPCDASGAVLDAPQERWAALRTALRDGYRGLPRGTTIVKLLSPIRGGRNNLARGPRLRLDDLILWARAYRRRMGAWPDRYSGRIADAKGETWYAMDEALQQGLRGLPSGSSLSRFVAGLRAPRAIKIGFQKRSSLRLR